MKLQKVKGTTDQSILIYIKNSSTGLGLTGLVYNTTDLTCYYARPGAAAAQLSLVTQTVSGTHTDGGFVEVDSTNMPGVYRLDLSDTILSSGVDSVLIMLQGAANMDDLSFEIQLVTFDLDSSAPDVNTIQISGDSLAADNLESTYDGTGYTNDYGPAQQQQLNNLSVGSASISKTAESAVITIGTQSGTYLDTFARDGNFHQLSDVAGVTDFYYQFDIGGNGIPTSITHYGRSTGNNDDINVYGYNWSTSLWEQIGTIPGGAVNIERTFSLYSSHVGTGVNIGKVRVRFYNTGLTSAVFYTDQLYLSYTIVTQSVGYANGAIWIDTNDGTAGTVPFVNGVADNPCLTYADALNISSQIGLKVFEISPGSSITFAADTDGFDFNFRGSSLNLDGQEVTNCNIRGATLTGIATGGGALLFIDRAIVGTVSLPPCILMQSALTDVLTLSEAGTYILDLCGSAVAGSGSPTIDFGASIGNTNLNMRHYSGGIEILNMGTVGTDNMSLEGQGQLRIHSSCTGGTIVVRGNFKITDNSGGAVSIDDTANFKDWIIHSGFAQAASNNTITLSNMASSIDGAYDPDMLFIYSGTGAGQSRLIIEYNGTSKIATVDRNWKVNPDTTSQYRIIANYGLEHVNEGKAQAGSANNITLNTLASNYDNEYIDQLIFIRSGTGEDQVRRITAYNGTTKIATVDQPWETNPDNTSGYKILPLLIRSGCSETLNDLAANEIDKGNTINVGQAIRAIFNRFFRTVKQTELIQTVENDSDTTISTMQVSDDGTTQEKGAAE